MPFGGLLALAGPALSIGSSLFGMSQGTPASQVPSYNYQGMPQADQGALSGIGNLSQYNVAGNLLPQYQNIAQQGVNNPYAQSYINNAAATGQAGMGTGAALTGSALSTLPDVQALISLGFDPQQALYSKLQNQNQQQNAAILGQSGVAGTPYGAGVMADANSNFNINWQNQQLQRALQGVQGAGNLLGQAGQTAGTGLNQMATGAGLPYNAFQGINTNALNTLAGAGQFGQQAAMLPQQQIQDYLQYLSQGAQQQGQNVQQANSVFQQNQALGQGLGQGLAGLSKGLGNMGWGNTGGFGNFNTNPTYGSANFGLAAGPV